VEGNFSYMKSSRSAEDRVHIAEEVERRLDPVMGMLGIIFALVVVAEAFVRPQGAVGTAVTVASWGLWAVFVIEFASRMAIAPSKSRFLKKNWWQAIFLAFPFLRLLRVLRVARLARAGRLVSSSLRAGRSAAGALTGRIGWLVGFTVVVVLSTAQGLFEFGGYDSYADALFDAAMASITGQGVQGDSAVSRVLSIVLALYSVAVFASLAAALGAYFMRPDEVDNQRDEVVG
jgi:voltage-gated potassium channel